MLVEPALAYWLLFLRLDLLTPFWAWLFLLVFVLGLVPQLFLLRWLLWPILRRIDPDFFYDPR